MGIQGLLPQLKSIMTSIHIKDLKDHTVAVDTYSWLHKGALSCSRELCKGLPSSRHIDYCMYRVNLLRHHGIKPLLVFDGGLLPMKSDQEAKRLRTRKENFERAAEHESAGNFTAAYECYQKAVDISPAIASDLIQVLKQENVDYIVAPYEADAQMAFLSLHNVVDAVITEDSDLIPFGCSRIIFKMDKFGQGVEFRSSMLSHNKELNFFGFTKQMILEMCILSGCDYLQSLPGMGLKRAHAFIQNFKSYDKVIRHLRYNTSSVPPLYEESFQKAIWTFQHQRVYDPRKEDIVHLTEIPDDISIDWDFVGPSLPQDVVKRIARGDLDPITKLSFQENMEGRNSIRNKFPAAKVFEQTKEKKRIHLPVQKNILTNYFCLASIEAKRKFKAPKIKPKHLEVAEETCTSNDMHICPSCTSEDACAADGLHNTLAGQENPVDSKIFHDLMDESESKVAKFTGESFHGKLKRHTSLLQSKNTLCVPVLASHKEHVKDSLLDTSTDKKIHVEDRIKSGLQRTFNYEDEDSEYRENKMECKEDSADILGEIPLPKASIRGNHLKNATKKRKFSCSNIQEDSELMKDGCQDRHAKGDSLLCDISHLDRYSGIAEESMKRFVSVISAFRFTSNGSRASGLRRPLKNIQNTSVDKYAESCLHKVVLQILYLTVPFLGRVLVHFVSGLVT